MSITPHVFDLTGFKAAADEVALPEVESINDLEQLLDGSRIPAACQFIDDYAKCECVTCATLGGPSMFHVQYEAFALATVWRIWAADEVMPAHPDLIRLPDEWRLMLRFKPASEPEYDIPTRGRNYELIPRLLTDAPGLIGRRLSDIEATVADASTLKDWRGRWRGLHWHLLDLSHGLDNDAAAAQLEEWHREPVETPTNNALIEFWRGRHLIRKARASGARQRAIDALRRKVGPLEPLALDYARRALIDPLNAAVAAVPER